MRITANKRVIDVDLPEGTVVKVNQLQIMRSRPAVNSAGRQTVVLDLTPGSKVHVIGVSGLFKFQQLVINVDTGSSWAEVNGGSGSHMRAFPVEKLIPPSWAVRPRNFEYGVHDGEDIGLLGRIKRL